MRVVRRVFRIMAWVFVSLLGLILLVYLLLQLPAVQDFAKGKVVAFLKTKLKTDVRIGKLSITFPKRIVLEDVYFADQKGDTLLAGKKLRADIAFFKLLNNKVEINYIELDSIRTIHECIQEGIITDWFLFAPNCLRIAPPLSITVDELKNFCQRFIEILDTVQQNGC